MYCAEGWKCPRFEKFNNYSSAWLVLWNAQKDTLPIWQSSWFFAALVLFTWALLANWLPGKSPTFVYRFY